ncbi:hypothetical protein XI05_16675 [Bradyrhizobium sp. CCBAU 11357]|nr:hypothetical protein [Bradyrhizobium sp. CCBAU 11357]
MGMKLGPIGGALGEGHRENLAIGKAFPRLGVFRLSLSAILIRLAVGAAVTAAIAIAVIAPRAMHQAAARAGDGCAGEGRGQQDGDNRRRHHGKLAAGFQKLPPVIIFSFRRHCTLSKSLSGTI